MIKRLLELTTLCLGVTFSITTVQACDQAYQYSDAFQINTNYGKKTFSEQKTVSGIIHVRTLSDKNEKQYTLFWLEDLAAKDKIINTNSIHTPFLVINDIPIDKKEIEKPNFIIKELQTPSHNKKLHSQLIGLVELLQFQTGDGAFQWLDSMGKANIEQKSIDSHAHTIKRLKQYQKGNESSDITFLESNIQLEVDNTGCFLNKTTGDEQVKSTIEAMKAEMLATRHFKLLKDNQKRLPAEHWFMQLGTDISTWKLPEGSKITKNIATMPLKEAITKFTEFKQQMLAAIQDKDERVLDQWVLKNIAFLKNLPSLLKENPLDDELSKKLFASLGFIDTPETVAILGNVLLTTDVPETERFRSLMALKNTNAQMDEQQLDAIIDYGLNPTTTNDYLQKATGMLAGTFAKERIENNPSQAEYISEKVVSAIQQNSNNTVVALAAAGNMHEMATANVLAAVESSLMTSSDTLSKAEAAESIDKIGRTNLTSTTFESLWSNEKSQETKEKIILASARAEDATTNTQYQQSLLNIAQDKHDVANTRMAALGALQTAGYGKNNDQKAVIKKLMIGETDKAIILKMAKLYRGE